jgi:hypothetical protein
VEEPIAKSAAAPSLAKSSEKDSTEPGDVPPSWIEPVIETVLITRFVLSAA